MDSRLKDPCMYSEDLEGISFILPCSTNILGCSTCPKALCEHG